MNRKGEFQQLSRLVCWSLIALSAQSTAKCVECNSNMHERYTTRLDASLSTRKLSLYHTILQITVKHN